MILEGGPAALQDTAHADRAEATSVAAYRARKAFVDGVREAVRRAEARARLDAVLHRMQGQQPEVA